MAASFREGHLVGDGSTYAPLWGAGVTVITPLPSESGTPPADPLSGGNSGKLTVFVNQGTATDPTYVRLGNSGDGRPYVATENAQAIASIPISPGDAIPEIKAPSGVYIDFRLGVLS